MLPPLFWELHRQLPREGPGSTESTGRAANLLTTTPTRILDIGCGPGQQTVDLARLFPEADITAVDLHQPFLDDLESKAEGLKITTTQADMRTLPYPDASFDLLWCEGAAYFMGSLAQALDGWKHLLAPGGQIALTEPVWLDAAPPEPVKQCWAEYPAMLDVPGCRQVVADSDYTLLGDFVLPAEAWWEYYRPLETRLALLEKEHPDSEVLQEARREVECYRQHGHLYSYLFLAMQRTM